MTFIEEKVAKCRLCAGAAYQSFPVFACGSHQFGRLIIGQNPGEIKPTDTARLQAADIAAKMVEMPFFDDHERAATIVTYYAIDFGSSPAATRMKRVFGENWFDHWSFTNAVKCRTVGNSKPSDEMIENCTEWTRVAITAYGRHTVVVMGAVARTQVENILGVNLGWNTPIFNEKTKRGIIAIPHFSAWSYHSASDLDSYTDNIHKLLLKEV